jgi:hypothetical protein
MLSRFSEALRYFAGEARHKAAGVAQRALRITGREMLNRQETAEYLALLTGTQPNPAVLPHLSTASQGSENLSIMRSGLVQIDGRNWLDLDYGTRAGLLDWSKPRTSYSRTAALWSHPWMGYYHWIIDILPKICLLQEKFGADLGGVKLCYPSSEAAFEKESLRLLGIPHAAVHNTRIHGAVNANEIWCNQLIGWEKIHPMAKLVRERLLPFKKTEGNAKRIYVGRKGRRRCVNEEDVTALLNKHNFVVVEDKDRSLSDQIGLFHDAEYIVAPHGAALTNLLWCRPGTRVLEFFDAGYQADYYRNLCEYGGLDYRRLVFGTQQFSHWSAVADNIRADLPSLVKGVEEMVSPGLQISVRNGLTS